MISTDEILAGHGPAPVLHCLGEDPGRVPVRAAGARAR